MTRTATQLPPIPIEMLEESARVLRVMAHPHRLRFIELLMRGRLEERIKAVEALVTQYLTNRAARTLASAAPSITLPGATTSLQAWRLQFRELLGLQGAEWLPQVVDVWAYRWFNIGAFITATQGTLDNTSILVRDGIIIEIGPGLEARRGTTVIDGAGAWVMPGISDCHSHMAAAAINEGTQSITAQVRIADVLRGDDITLYRAAAGGVTAADLGLTATGATAEFSAGSIVGIDLDPKLTWRTSVGQIDGQALGSVRIENAGQVRVIDLSGARTFGDVKNLIEGADIGVRVEINAGRDGIDVVNEVSAGRVGAMSISGISAGDTTAERLGIRSFSALTRVTDFNFGAGVEVLSGRSDPLTGQPDPTLDRDFRVTLGNGRAFDVDLRPSDMVTVGTIIARINAQAASQGIRVPADFQAALSPTSNGISFTQDGAFAQPIQIAKLNDSPAFSQLGLKDGAPSNGGATFTSSDRSKVRVSSVFSDLLDLHGALMSNDTFGITFAAEHLEEAVDRVSQARALVGGFTNRVTKAIRSQEDQALLDEQIRSEMRDLDFAEAAVRLNLLQTQLMASLQTTAMMGSRTLLDFLG
ncbi:MAG: hypothetical protein IIC49_01440 [Planctomycetes bacterium]|nr:hypothetical protein [Planctomycetota bacterium]